MPSHSSPAPASPDRRRLLNAATVLAGSAVLAATARAQPTHSESQADQPQTGKLQRGMVSYMLAHEQFTVPELVRIGALASQAGFHVLSTSDHIQPWQANEKHAGQAWVTMGALGAQAPRSWMGTTVTCPTMRYNPAVVAEAFASLNDLYPGRIFLGVGSGEALNEEAATGMWPKWQERWDRLIEAIGIIRALWAGQELAHRGMLQGLRKKARSLGANYVKDRVVGLEASNNLVRSAVLELGAIVKAGHVVNCAGAWAKEICAMLGIPLPVEPMRRFDTYFEYQGEIEPLPYMKDLSRLAMRPEGRGFTAGLVDWNEPRGFNFDVDHSYFQSVVWPAAAHRIPAFQTIKEGSSWSGLYDQNGLDANMILGAYPGRYSNFLMTAGFSGHGLMHAPAVGRAIKELILDDGFETLDLSRMGYQRVIDNAPYRENGIV